VIDADEIRLMSDALAADPGSLVFLQLGEALRRQGQLDLAWRVATRGVERHAQRPDAHDLLARVAADRGDFDRARAAWESALALSPGHPAAQKGLGFLLFQQGLLKDAERLLSAAQAADPGDASLANALARIRALAAEAAVAPGERAPTPPPVGPTPPRGSVAIPAPSRPSRTTQALAAPVPFAPAATDARDVFLSVLPDPSHAALLLDADGLVVAGRYRGPDGQDLAADVGAQLSGVSDEASRAMRHLGMGAWTHLAVEAEGASVAMAPSGDGIVLVAAPRRVPLGFVRRVLDRAVERARRWLESGT
jgi:predicted regulator of Ras-like GTPase activity (Roadblock/LC7/MglB family)